MRQRGLIDSDLISSIPRVASWRLSRLPKSLPPAQVERLLQCCDRSTPVGQRDYAILLLMARLGLRGGEVARDDLGRFRLGTERDPRAWPGFADERLPLPKDVGAAMVRYLRHVRPTCSTRKVFIRMKAPFRAFADSDAIYQIVRSALKRAGFDHNLKGGHLLRHSLATDLLRKGASFSEIGQLLRHPQPTTTQIYAKVDIGALRRLPSPGWEARHEVTANRSG